jgi:hypothetical protein
VLSSWKSILLPHAPVRNGLFPSRVKKSEGDLDNPKKVIIVLHIFHKSTISVSYALPMKKFRIFPEEDYGIRFYSTIISYIYYKKEVTR